MMFRDDEAVVHVKHRYTNTEHKAHTVSLN